MAFGDILFASSGKKNAKNAAKTKVLEIAEAPPAADEASQFRGSGTIGTPNGRGNRNAATVTASKNGSRLFAAVRGGLGSR